MKKNVSYISVLLQFGRYYAHSHLRKVKLQCILSFTACFELVQKINNVYLTAFHDWEDHALRNKCLIVSYSFILLKLQS